MIRRFLFVIALAVCGLFFDPSALEAATAATYGSAAFYNNSSSVQDLKDIRTLTALYTLHVETVGSTSQKYGPISITLGFDNLPPYFQGIANAFQTAGYPNVASVFRRSGAQVFHTLIRRKNGRKLGEARQFSRRLADAISMAKTFGVVPPEDAWDIAILDPNTLTKTYTTPDYLLLATIFVDNLNRAIRNVAKDRPIAKGITNLSDPITLTITKDESGNVLSVTSNLRGS